MGPSHDHFPYNIKRIIKIDLQIDGVIDAYTRA